MRALVMATLLAAASMTATAQVASQSGAQSSTQNAAPAVENVQAAARAAAPKAPMDRAMIVPKSQIDAILNPAPGTKPPTRLFDGGTFSANVIHRKPGDTEGALLHKYTSEVYFVQSGGGTLVTGGKLAEPVNAKDPDMQASKSIEGGTPIEVHAGDVVFIPAGLPHYFISYAPDIIYLNVRFQDPKYVAN